MFKNPFSFEGRIRRTEFGLSMIIYFIPSLIINIMAQSQPIILIAILPLLWFLWAQGAKRCHDRNNTGWFQVIPFYGFWLLFAEGDSGENDYGADPKMKSNEGSLRSLEV